MLQHTTHTGASKVMISKKFALAMGLDLRELRLGSEFITASGAIEQPLGVTPMKIMFTLAHKTLHQCQAEFQVTIVNTLAYDALLGMYFFTAMGGAYDTWTEMFTYRWTDSDGEIQSHQLSALCHSEVPVASGQYQWPTLTSPTLLATRRSFKTSEDFTTTSSHLLTYLTFGTLHGK